MKSGLRRFYAFLTAEEIPRWFGLSIVLIYLVGLGAVSRWGIVQARDHSAAASERAYAYAFESLGRRLRDLHSQTPRDLGGNPAVRVVLRDFSSTFNVATLRVVDGQGVVVASTKPTEVGAPRPGFDPSAYPSGLIAQVEEARNAFGEVGLRARMTIGELGADSTTSAPATPTGQEATVIDGSPPPRAALYLEAFQPPMPAATGIFDLLIILFVVLGALFVVYRCLREQMRGMSQIAERLRGPHDSLHQDLAALRIPDEFNDAVKRWNELVHMLEESTQAIGRQEANAELSRVLAHAGGGALAEALNALPDGLVYISEEVRFDYANAAACRLLSTNLDELRKDSVPSLRTEGVGEKIMEIIRSSLQPDGAYMPRAEVFQVGDSEKSEPSTYRLWVIPLRRPGRSGECLVVIRDVSQQVRAERAREDFVSQVTHELRTPLTNIRAYAETLSSGMFDDPNVVTECYNVITKETRRLARLIEDILSVSQLEVGSIELHVDTVDLRNLLTEGVRDVRGLADEKNIDIQLALPAKLDAVQADRDKLAVVVNNLLGNAIKYTPEDGNVVVGCQVGGDGVLITVKDNGIGIDPPEHAKVFEKFYRADSEQVQAETGTGIGLYTAREIVRRHGGDIELISAKGEGSTFMVRLPHRESRASAMSTSAAGQAG